VPANRISYHCAIGSSVPDIDAVKVAQSSASRFSRKVLMSVGQPLLRMIAFQVPPEV